MPSNSGRDTGCPSQAHNQKVCTCTYPGCPRHGLCCQCLPYHLRMDELPACCFSPEAERTYDRSFRRFIGTHR